MYYRKCEHCGANLDPSEKCECLEIRELNKEKYKEVLAVDNYGQLSMIECLCRIA